MIMLMIKNIKESYTGYKLTVTRCLILFLAYFMAVIFRTEITISDIFIVHFLCHKAIHLSVFLYVSLLYRLYCEFKKSCEKPPVQFQPNLAGLSLGLRAPKFVQRI
jgi:hypothetical protein